MILTNTILLLQVLLMKFVWSESQKSVNSLQRRYMSDSDAVCNDNSRATFFIGVQSSNKWILFFESGGFCASLVDCNKRYLNENSTVLMTSTLMPKEVIGRDLLSSSQTENPSFYDYRHVLVPYCSSDLWLGQRTNPKKPFRFVNDSSVDNFSFRGQTIFRTLFMDLLRGYNLREAEEIVLSGSSAGGIGVLNHAGWVLDHVIKSQGLNAKLKSIVDSGWFINFQDSLEAKVRPRFMSFANITSAACKDTSRDYICCPSASCMIARGYYPSDVPLLIVSSIYDLFMLGDVISAQDTQENTATDNSADYLTLVSMYGGAMNESISLIGTQASNVSIFAPACFQHIYLSTSSLWEEGGVLPPSAEVGRGPAKYSHKIQSGTWESTKIQTKTYSSNIKDFIAKWMQSNGSSMTLIDSCVGAHCNPTCPGQFLFTDPAAIWKQSVQTTILLLSLVITIVSLGFKATFFLQHYYLNRKQKHYLNEFASSPVTRELPPCAPHEMTSIPCLFLSYSVNVAHQKPTKDKAANKSEADSNEAKTECPVNIKQHTICDIDGTGGSENHADPPVSTQAVNLGFATTPEKKPVNSQKTIRFSDSETDFEEFNKVDGLSTDKERRNSLQTPWRKLSDPPYAKIEQGNPREKKILDNVSVYFNPGELVAIMGPSGSGKTTLLDLLTGRRTSGHSQGSVYINGESLGDVQDWYARRIGYVLQLALKFFFPACVHLQNLTLSHAPKRKVLKHENHPQQPPFRGITFKVLFVGLDASSSLELLQHLNVVAESGRLIILTIHQPRLEIFHLFHKILLLCDGQVAFYGEPTNVPSLFVEAYLKSTTKEFRMSENAPKIDAKNPAGTVYFRAEEKDGILLMSAFCVYCCASPLFLSSVLMAHLNKVLDVITSYDLWKFTQVTIISLVLNQTWIAVYMMVICAQPRIAHRICPMVSATAGFAGGFLVPRPLMPPGYNLLFFINPQFYGYAAITKVLLKNNRLKCQYESTLNCISTEGNAVLSRFGFHDVNIYEHLAILLGMTVLSLLLAWFFLELKYIIRNLFFRKSSIFSKDERFESPKVNVHGRQGRQKSTLRVISENDGLHSVRVQGREEAQKSRRPSSRKERWQSARKRLTERKQSLEEQQEIIQNNWDHFLRCRSFSLPPDADQSKIQETAFRRRFHSEGNLRVRLPDPIMESTFEDDPDRNKVRIQESSFRRIHCEENVRSSIHAPKEERPFKDVLKESEVFQVGMQLSPVTALEDRGNVQEVITDNRNQGSNGDETGLWIKFDDGGAKERPEFTSSLETTF
ncbi:unnamed protein product [Porites evermanni]|uniref:AAA+ ATPase domain-containing protein n=1 Tax=Porites evermanni TaxID=104178 RepID=A0ABN8S7L3_9CNID|nr:unnamed protein product [Porites evermanni]